MLIIHYGFIKTKYDVVEIYSIRKQIILLEQVYFYILRFEYLIHTILI